MSAAIARGLALACVAIALAYVAPVGTVSDAAPVAASAPVQTVRGTGEPVALTRYDVRAVSVAIAPVARAVPIWTAPVAPVAPVSPPPAPVAPPTPVTPVPDEPPVGDSVYVPSTGDCGEGAYRIEPGTCEWYVPPCETEDGSDGPIPCVWDASTRGNGEGRSFTIDAQGAVHYRD